MTFVERLANYKYFDMDQAIDNALQVSSHESATFRGRGRPLFREGDPISYEARLSAVFQPGKWPIHIEAAQANPVLEVAHQVIKKMIYTHNDRLF